MEEIGAVVAFAKLVLEPLGEPVDDMFAVVCSFPASLFFLDDCTADAPVGSTMAVLTACQAPLRAAVRISRTR